MFYKKILTPGLAHHTYMIGAEEAIAVIDPMRDVGKYLHEARKAGMRIKYILETHRNEDYISGSRELAHQTGARIYLSGHEELGYEFGEKIWDGFRLDIGGMTLEALHTPGHTLGHMSYALYEKDMEAACMVFTGDCMFMGDFGRTDFYGKENLDKMTGLLYDSLFRKILPLGGHVILLPAHGAGSACGKSMDDRPYSTLGYEQLKNDLLRVASKEEFIDRFAEMRIKPQYFDTMEKLNVEGAAFVADEVILNPLSPGDVKKLPDSVLLIDVRSKEAYIGGHIPGSLYLSQSNLTAYLGALYPTDQEIAFITEGKMDEMEEIYWYCRRMGFDRIRGYLPEGIKTWQAEGFEVEQFETVSAKEYKKMPKGDDFVLLDIRSPEEIKESDPDLHSVNIPLKILREELDKLPRDKDIYVLCSSGNRSTTAASCLKMAGLKPIVITGGAEMYRKI